MKHDFSDIISLAERYLRQQQEQFGPDLYRQPTPPRAAAPGGGAEGTARIPESPALGLFDAAPVGAGGEPWQDAATLEELRGLICDCRKCPLGATRRKFVFGVGNPDAKAILVGEAPGADEDAQGEPFVGRAGQLLNKILAAIGFQREEVFICNILKCRPPNNRDPLAAEVEQCEPYLHKQMEILQPKIILALGRIAAQTLLRTNASLTAMRAKTHTYRGIPLLVTFHPAAILRNPNWKRPTWEDVQKFRSMYDQLTA